MLCIGIMAVSVIVGILETLLRSDPPAAAAFKVEHSKEYLALKLPPLQSNQNFKCKLCNTTLVSEDKVVEHVSHNSHKKKLNSKQWKNLRGEWFEIIKF